ncbi:MAG: FAD binding domain-containing protein [Polyangiaceae bacterium]
MSIRFTLNGQVIEAREFDPNTTLLSFLRARGLTGTKEGCGEGECGACAVVLVRRDADGRARYEPVNGCLFLLGSCADQEIVTVEGVARNGQLHPVQAALVERAGSQCGYCTPGFVMSLFAEYYRPDRDGYDPEAIGGNLCRCTGYRPIADVAKGLGRPEESDAFHRRLALAPPELGAVAHVSGHGRFLRPRTLSDALTLWRAHRDAILVAGGTDLVVEVNQRHRRIETWLSLENVAELRGFSWDAERVRIGAGLSLSDLEHRVRGRLPMLEQLLPLFSSRLIRNRATLGGNLMTASPIGDSAPALLALDAEVELTSLDGSRSVPLSEFFVGYRKTCASPGEILSAVTLPLPLPSVQRFYKVSKRAMDDISTVSAGFSLRLAEDRSIESARLAYGGVAATPARALEAEEFLKGKTLALTRARELEPILAKTFQPLSDQRGSAEYRRQMLVRLLEKFCFEVEGSPS